MHQAVRSPSAPLLFVANVGRYIGSTATHDGEDASHRLMPGDEGGIFGFLQLVNEGVEGERKIRCAPRCAFDLFGAHRCLLPGVTEPTCGTMRLARPIALPPARSLPG